MKNAPVEAETTTSVGLNRQSTIVTEPLIEEFPDAWESLFAGKVFQPNQCQALQEPRGGAVGEFILRTTKTVRLCGEIRSVAKFVQHVAVVWQYVALTSNSSHNTYATMV